MRARPISAAGAARQSPAKVPREGIQTPQSEKKRAPGAALHPSVKADVCPARPAGRRAPTVKEPTRISGRPVSGASKLIAAGQTDPTNEDHRSPHCLHDGPQHRRADQGQQAQIRAHSSATCGSMESPKRKESGDALLASDKEAPPPSPTRDSQRQRTAALLLFHAGDAAIVFLWRRNLVLQPTARIWSLYAGLDIGPRHAERVGVTEFLAFRRKLTRKIEAGVIASQPVDALLRTDTATNHAGEAASVGFSHWNGLFEPTARIWSLYAGVHKGPGDASTFVVTQVFTFKSVAATGQRDTVIVHAGPVSVFLILGRVSLLILAVFPDPTSPRMAAKRVTIQSSERTYFLG